MVDPVNELRTDLGEERVAGTGSFRGYVPPHDYTPPMGSERRGYYGGRHIIGHDSRINGGVYIGGTAREAIVVDDSRDNSSLLRDSYAKLRHAIVRTSPLRYRWRNKVPVAHALKAAYDYTQQLIPYDLDATHKITDAYPSDQKLDITKFIGGGVCRHQALLAGYFTEKMIDEGLLNGEVHVERNSTTAGAHAWVKYTPSSGEVYFIDPAQQFIGTAREAASAQWDYTLPE